MRYASLENDIMLIIMKHAAAEDLGSFKRIVSEAVEIINRVKLFHFDGLRVKGVNKQEQDNIKIYLEGNGGDFILTISSDGKTLDMNEVCGSFFHFGLKESSSVSGKNDVRISFEWANSDVIDIIGVPSYTDGTFTISYYTGVAKKLGISNKELNLAVFKPDETYTDNGDGYKASINIDLDRINNALETAHEMGEKLKNSPYQKKWKGSYNQ